MKYFIILGSVILLSRLDLNIAKELPSFITKCKKDTSMEELEKCLINAVATLMPVLAKEGLPELNLPIIEPLKLPQIQLKRNNLDIIWTDLEFFGLSDVEVQKAKLSFSEGLLELQFRIPTIRITGHYQLIGKLLMFDLNTSGGAFMNMTEFHSESDRKFEIENKGGKDFLKFKEVTKLELNYNNAGLKAENIINGNEHLSNEVNKMINENLDEITKELNPLVMQAFTDLVEHSFINPMLEDYSLDELFD